MTLLLLLIVMILAVALVMGIALCILAEQYFACIARAYIINLFMSLKRRMQSLAILCPDQCSLCPLVIANRSHISLLRLYLLLLHILASM